MKITPSINKVSDVAAMLNNNMLKPSQLYFSLHTVAEYEGDETNDDNCIMIVFCPIFYWNENKCVPYYFFADKMNDINFPEGYFHYSFSEETIWQSEKSQEEIRNDLNEMGFVENVEMKQFLDRCRY